MTLAKEYKLKHQWVDATARLWLALAQLHTHAADVLKLHHELLTLEEALKEVKA